MKLWLGTLPLLKQFIAKKPASQEQALDFLAKVLTTE